MKKWACLLLAVVCCLGCLAGCGNKISLEEATKKADTQLETWTEQNYNLFHYSKMDGAAEGFYNVLLVDTSENELMLTKSIVEVTLKDVYKALSKCFKGHDVKIGVTVATSDGEPLYIYTNDMLAGLK